MNASACFELCITFSCFSIERNRFYDVVKNAGDFTDISLSGDFDGFIKEQMATRLYKSVNDIIQETMSLLRLRKSVSQDRIDAFNAEIQKDEDDIAAGRVMDGKTAFEKLMSKYD